MSRVVVDVEGLAELNRALRSADDGSQKMLRQELKEMARLVRDDARAYMLPRSRKSGMGIRDQVRGTTGFVEQRYGTVTGQRGDWGAFNMKVMAVAAQKKKAEIEERAERMVQRIGRREGF